MPFGDDFRFCDAEKQFSNMDQIVNYINAHSDEYNMDARYVTLDEYFGAVYNQKMSWPTFEGDFAVYSDGQHR